MLRLHLRRPCRQFLGRGALARTPPSVATSRSMSSTAPPSPCVSLDLDESTGVALLTLCNPQRRNALTVSMMEELEGHVRTLAQWSTGVDASGEGNGGESAENNARAVIVTGSDGTFCSGLDLHDNAGCSSHPLREGGNMLRHMTRVTNHLHSLPLLSVAAVDGHAVGGGAELTTATDLVVLSHRAQIQFVHAKRGASPGWGGARRLVRKIGRRKALRMLLLGERVTGEEEARNGGGYADTVGEEGETALEATMRLIDPMLKLPCSQSARAIKGAVSAVDGDGEVIDSNGELVDRSAGMTREFASFLSVWGGDSNKKQIERAKERLKGKGDKKE